MFVNERVMIDLSIIIVNWNCIAYTEQCLASIRDHSNGIDLEVIVVDNDSADAPCSTLLEKFPKTKLILSKENIGFGRANNLGVRHSEGRYLLFLNPDTVVLRDSLQRMISALERTPGVGALGCRLLNSDGSLQTTAVQSFPTILNQIFALAWLQQKWPTLKLWGKQALYSAQPDVVHDVDFVSGAAILVKREVFELIGGFNPAYFMYAEEADLCLAIHKRGFRVGYTNRAQIIHFGGRSTTACDDTFAHVTMQQSIYTFLQVSRGPSYAALYRLTLFSIALGRLGILLCMLPFAAAFDWPIKGESAKRGCKKWITIARWGLRFIPDNRHRATPSASFPGSKETSATGTAGGHVRGDSCQPVATDVPVDAPSYPG